jgi:hypothetical protein
MPGRPSRRAEVCWCPGVPFVSKDVSNSPSYPRYPVEEPENVGRLSLGREDGFGCSGGRGIRRVAERARECERPEASGRPRARVLDRQPPRDCSRRFSSLPRSLAFYAISLHLLTLPRLGFAAVYAHLRLFRAPYAHDMPTIRGASGRVARCSSLAAHAAYAAVISDKEGG